MSPKPTLKPPRSLADLLSGGELGAVAAEARRRRDLTHEIRALLPAEMAAHLVMAGTSPTGELVLTMDASVWAARVRYHAEELGGQRVRVKVQPQG
jgi:hypothetical protein